MNSLSSLIAFVHAAETRSFTTAGRRLGVSSSAIGKAMARLESRVGVRLFHRSTRTVSLTPEGTCFLERSRRILAEIEAAERDLAETRGAPRGKLRVGEPGDSRLVSRALGQFRLALVASPEYLRRRGVPSTPADLTEHACLRRRDAVSGKLESWPLRAGGVEGEVAVPATAVASTIEPLVCMAESGLGIACVPDFTIRRQLADGTLLTVLDDHVEHTGHLRLLWPSNRYVTAKLRAFVDFMAENLLRTVPTAGAGGSRAKGARGARHTRAPRGAPRAIAS
ncbi:MAG TPA: LysR substrate-binding domain-containing protein [Gemmatimonadaceae bacterium]